LKKPVVVSLVQITEDMLQFVNLPYAIGLLQAYAQTHASDPGRYLFTLPIFERGPLAQRVRELSLADIVGFSLYVWNAEYSLALARALKLAKPEVLVVVGGPHVPDQPDLFLQQNPWVDLCVHGEGEETFLQILENYPALEHTQIQGLSYRFDKHLIQTELRSRSRNLDRMVSPFLKGVFEPLFYQYPDYRWVTVWETNRGCPFSCAFCDWGSATKSKVLSFALERLQAELEWFARQKIEVIFCADANFGIFPRDLQIAEAMAELRKKTGYPHLFYTQTAKNAPDRVFETQSVLFEAGLHAGTTLSLQTVSEPALSAILRENISLKAYQELQTRFHQAGMPTYTDVLVGLPGETLASFREGVGRMIASGQHREMRFYNVFILPNAELAAPAYREQHQIVSVRLPYRTPLSRVQPPVEGLQEWQEMIVATRSFSDADWLQMRVFAWMTQILYFSKALQMPIMLMHQAGLASYQTILQAFCELQSFSETPFFASLNQFLKAQAEEILAGKREFCQGQESPQGPWVWMSPDYFTLVYLLKSEKLAQFYAESEDLLVSLAQSDPRLPRQALKESLELSQALLMTPLPGHAGFARNLHWNIWEVYQAGLSGQQVPLRSGLWFFEAQAGTKGLQTRETLLSTSF